MALVESFLERHLAGERADRALKAILKSANLDGDDRRLLADWTLGIAVWRGRLDIIAEGDRRLWLPLFLVDRECRDQTEAAAFCEVPIGRVRRALAIRDSHADTLAFRRSLPEWLAHRWIDQLGTERADRLAAAMNERGPVAVRANRLRCDRDDLQIRLRHEGVHSRPSSIAPDGLVLPGRANIRGLETWRSGLFEVQDEGSQLIAHAAAAKPGEFVVDLCAGSGGKTLALAAAMKNEGRLVAVDIDPMRLADLKSRVARNGVSCVTSRVADATRMEGLADLKDQADVVLVDAPCSELGTLRRSPDARWRIVEDDLRRWSELQRSLLRTARQLVKLGGRLVYATCSVDPIEDEDVAATVPPSEFTLCEKWRVWPDTDGCDGFFWAVWQRSAV